MSREKEKEIGRFASESEAALAAGRLQAEGADARVVRDADSTLFGMTHGVRVMAPAEQFERALSVLRKWKASESSPERKSHDRRNGQVPLDQVKLNFRKRTGADRRGASVRLGFWAGK